ncbi:type II toxin-antitoxin system YafQ family toxin [Duncaniella muris]|uniref:type II toxin-antitoxin system YafQ family toxin n=1 Tax=Duncaniella muris TaxID=2094150 RepID=UPI00338D6D46
MTNWKTYLTCWSKDCLSHEENRPHILTGNYKGYMECHVESDTLLIWWDKEAGIIKLIRFGTHSELF